jgi:hypothetical protein
MNRMETLVLIAAVFLIHVNICSRAFSIQEQVNKHMIRPRTSSSSSSSSTRTALLAHHPYNHSHKNRNSFSSKTSRESAVIVEWEPVSNLERRIEEGVNYHHDVFSYESIRQSKKNGRTMNVGKQMMEDDSMTTRVHGVFVGYRVTKEERERMKSAHPVD